MQLASTGKVRVRSAPRSEAEFLTPEDAAVELKVSARTLKRWRSKGGGPPFMRTGNTVRYSRKRIAEWMAETEHADNKPYVPAGRRIQR